MATLRYQPLGPLLAGGNSHAYLALEVADDRPPRPVALLWVPAEIADDGEQMGKLARETYRATLLEHPHLIRVFGLAALEDGMARVVEYIDGEGLARFLERTGKLPPALAVRLCAEAALGVHYAHEAGNEDGTPLVHGDLRPETIFVDYQGVTKVGGYGALAVAPKEPNGRRVLNRRLYAAPEQLVGGRDAVNRQTDVYLLGALLYRCLIGSAPFEGAEKFEEAVISAPLPPWPDDPLFSKLWPVVEKALAKRGADRFASARAFHDALLEAVPELPGRETLAAFLENQFPPEDEVRVARREALAKGLSELQVASEQRPSPAAVLPRAPAVREEPILRSPAFGLGLEHYDEPEPSYRRTTLSRDKGAKMAMGLGIALALLLIVGVVLLRRPRKTPVTPPIPSPSAPVAPVSQPPSQGQGAKPTPTGSEPLPPLRLPPPAPAPTTEEAPASAPPTSSKSGMLDLSTEPLVEVLEGEISLGRAPLRISLAAGRHVLRLRSKENGIDVTRSIEIKAGRENEERIRVGKGQVQLTAPEGAKVEVDGRRIGTAPLDPFPVYEGSHKIVVWVGKAKWQQPFSLQSGEKMYFTVEQE